MELILPNENIFYEYKFTTLISVELVNPMFIFVHSKNFCTEVLTSLSDGLCIWIECVDRWNATGSLCTCRCTKVLEYTSQVGTIKIACMYLSISDSFIVPGMSVGLESFNLKILSITDNSALVVSRPQNADQSFTTIPAPITSLPLLTEPTYTNHMILIGELQCVLTTSGT